MRYFNFRPRNIRKGHFTKNFQLAPPSPRITLYRDQSLYESFTLSKTRTVLAATNDARNQLELHLEFNLQFNWDSAWNPLGIQPGIHLEFSLEFTWKSIWNSLEFSLEFTWNSALSSLECSHGMEKRAKGTKTRPGAQRACLVENLGRGENVYICSGFRLHPCHWLN